MWCKIGILWNNRYHSICVKKRKAAINDLYGVITQIGQNGPNGHFVASCKSSINNKLYRFNDDIISSISNAQKEVIEFGIPYALFYKKQ